MDIFGKDTQYIQQESFYVMNDNNDQNLIILTIMNGELHLNFDSTNNLMNGLGLEVKVRGMQWQQILAQDCIFFLYEITNKSTTDYKKVVLGELVGTYIGNVESEADDDWSFFDVNSDLTYTGDFDNTITNNPNWQGDVGMVGYAFLESLVILMMVLITMVILLAIQLYLMNRALLVEQLILKIMLF